MRDVTIGQVKEAIVHVDFNYEEGDKGAFTPSSATSTSAASRAGRARYGLFLRGYERSPISNVRLTDCTFENVAKGDVLEHVSNVTLSNVTVNGATVNQNITR